MYIGVALRENRFQDVQFISIKYIVSVIIIILAGAEKCVQCIIIDISII